jgi:hypothetical protein
MTIKTAGALVFGVLLLTSCKVKESEDAEGDKQYQVETAPVNISTDTQTVRVPDIDIVDDSTRTTSTN